MLAGIGFILVFKQFPHAIGYDTEQFGLAFESTEGENTFTLLLGSLRHIEWGAAIISLISVTILITWEKTKLGNSGCCLLLW